VSPRVRYSFVTKTTLLTLCLSTGNQKLCITTTLSNEEAMLGQPLNIGTFVANLPTILSSRFSLQALLSVLTPAIKATVSTCRKTFRARPVPKERTRLPDPICRLMHLSRPGTRFGSTSAGRASLVRPFLLHFAPISFGYVQAAHFLPVLPKLPIQLRKALLLSLLRTLRWQPRFRLSAQYSVLWALSLARCSLFLRVDKCRLFSFPRSPAGWTIDSGCNLTTLP
jgi:hypothetical protein